MATARLRGRLLAVVITIIALSMISTGQSWYSVVVSDAVADSPALTTAFRFTGYETYPLAMPLLLVCLSAAILSSLSAVGLRKISTIILIVTSAGLAAVWFMNVSTENISEILPVLEERTGLASTSLADGTQADTLAFAYISGITYLCVMVGSVLLLRRGKFVSGTPKPLRKSNVSNRAQDPITLWDNQGEGKTL